ncbi:g2720 [Coccomyxa viridis]|uniref:G2720 protein n=1 Tax=Coccomyxa viridis TaxID=1274662 RepID=A0ABP1FL28_9CHLO
MDTTILTPRRGQNARRNETNGAANNRSSLEPAESSGSDEHGNDNAAGAPGSGDNSSDNDERSDAETEASSSEADEDSTDSEELPAMVNKLAENEIPATSIRVLFNKRLRGLKRKLEHLLLEFSQDRYMEIERRQAEKNGSRAEQKCRRQQRKYPRVQAQAHLALVFPDGRIHQSMSKDVQEHPLSRRGTELLATALEHLVQDQQLNMHMTAASSAAAAPIQSRPARGTSRLAQPRRATTTLRKLAAAPKPPAPSKRLVTEARRVFREYVRPLQGIEQPDSDIADATAAKLTVCGGSRWKDCSQQCGCMQSCAALREKSGWPESLPCVDPNARETSVDVNWANRFLSFAQECGWIIRAGHAPQPNRQALPGQAFRLRGTEPTPHEAAPAPAAAGISALLALQLGRPMPTEATADADNASDREALGRADPGDADVSGVRRHGQRRPPEAIPAGSPPPRRSGRDRIPSRRIADDVGDTSLMQPGARPFQAELRLTFGDDEEGQNVQQTVWSAWRGEASNRRQPLIDESNFEFATIGTLDLPEHAAYWQQLCNHQQLFTADALNVVKSSLERCSLQGDAQEETGQASQGAAPAPSPLASDTQFPLKQPFGDLDLQFSGERTHRESPEREASSAS